MLQVGTPDLMAATTQLDGQHFAECSGNAGD
jgi:hypothetical protein